MDKLVSVRYAVGLTGDGSTVAFGGNVLYRSPVKIAAYLALSGVSGLHIVKTAIALEADILCGAGCVSSVTAGFVGYETEFGLCNFYRKAVESGEVLAQEHACYSVMTGLRAAVQGVPFLPIRGMLGSDLIKAIGFKTVVDPYTGEELCAVRAIRPDVAYIHVQKADRFGNGEILGPQYEDLLIARSAEKLVLTCEELVGDDYFGKNHKADIPEVLTSCVAVLPNCASPGACNDRYGVDVLKMQNFKSLSTKNDLIEFLKKEVVAE